MNNKIVYLPTWMYVTSINTFIKIRCISHQCLLHLYQLAWSIERISEIYRFQGSALLNLLSWSSNLSSVLYLLSMFLTTVYFSTGVVFCCIGQNLKTLKLTIMYFTSFRGNRLLFRWYTNLDWYKYQSRWRNYNYKKVKVEKVKSWLRLSNRLERNDDSFKNVAGSSRFSPIPPSSTAAPPSPPDSSRQDSLLLFFFLGLSAFEVGSSYFSTTP